MVARSFKSNIICWKPGLASKRIATFAHGVEGLRGQNDPLETRTRFKEDCDPRPSTLCATRPRLETRTRFKEDCDSGTVPAPSIPTSPLETRTRFKEDCDYTPSPRGGAAPQSPLETRTRFKEDCDSRPACECSHRWLLPCWKPGLASKRIATFLLARARRTKGGQKVGNQDSLQRGLRRTWTPTSITTLTTVGNQDSLQRGLRPPVPLPIVKFEPIFTLETRTRFKEDCDHPQAAEKPVRRPPALLETRTRFKEDCDPPSLYYEWMALCWKPGLASKRIATRVESRRVQKSAGDSRWKPGLASKRIARLGMPLLGADLDLKRR